ncbi:MAG TPA: ribosome maturation factor RimM [Chitinophagaceae bacterium]|jgi:16S rRNA processing protein RimM
MEYFKIGKLVASFGVKGELILKHSLGKKSSLKGLQAIFIEEKKEAFIPWFIAATRIKTDDEIYVQLEGIDNREAAIKLTQKEVWIPEEEFKKHASKSSPLSLLGFSIINDGKDLGPVIELIEQPHQMLCRLEIDGKEVLIPLNEQTLQKVDKKTRRVFVKLPDGLLEIYLNP